MCAAPPSSSTSAPQTLVRALDELGLTHATLRPVWENDEGGLTFAVHRNASDSRPYAYAKWNPSTSIESLTAEAERLRWLAPKHPVSQVLGLLSYANEEVMLTRALPGESAIADRWKRSPRTALTALGAGLRKLHDVPIEDCPYSWSVEHRLRLAPAARASAGDAPPIDKLVLCQGDPCAPNTLLATDGSFLAHVDVARIGVADRWADLAVMTLSLGWNFETYDEADFWNAYGIEPDPVRIGYYRELWDAE